ncbi:MAG: hypothetical protein KME17_13960 [Cyanosarcina radialis HA8281-LM2]|jgi:hypothetical protein|nr:hypothetical protein [Cyanosarcina radialis HA8281-LM2]
MKTQLLNQLGLKFLPILGVTLALFPLTALAQTADPSSNDQFKNQAEENQIFGGGDGGFSLLELMHRSQRSGSLDQDELFGREDFDRATDDFRNQQRRAIENQQNPNPTTNSQPNNATQKSN